MRARPIVDRLIALPLRHKMIAVGIEVAFIAGCIVWARHLPPQEYTSSVLLFFDRTIVSRLDPAEMHTDREQAVDLAQSILSDDAVKTLCRKLGLFPDEASNSEAALFRSHLSLSRESTSAVRLTWRGGDRSQTIAAANAVGILLTSWVPSDAARRRPAHPVAAAPDLPAAVIDPSAPRELTGHGPEARPGMKSPKARLQIVLHDEEELRSQLASADQRQAALGNEAHSLEASIAQQDAKRQAALTARQPLMAQLTAEKKKLETLRARYTDAYPDVEAAQEKISEIESSLAGMPPVPPAPDGDQSRVRALTKEIDNLGAEKARLSSQLSEKAKEESNLRGREAESSTLASRLVQPSVSLSGSSNSILREQPPTPAPATASSQITDPAEGDEARVFKVLVPAVRAQPTDNPRQLLKWLVVVVGPLCGILYLLLAIWRFRAVRNVETLKRIVPGNIPYLGAIPGMNKWRHNV